MRIISAAIIIMAVTMRGNCMAMSWNDTAYVLSMDKERHAQLELFDTRSDKILCRIPLRDDLGFNCYVVDEKGGCYLSEARFMDRYGRNIYHYDPSSGKLELFVRLEGMFGPTSMALTDDQLIVQVTGNDRTRLKSGIIFIDRLTKKVTGKVFLKEDDNNYSQANINLIHYNGGRYIFLTSFYVMRTYDRKKFEDLLATGDIYVVDIEKNQITRSIKVDREYKYLYGVCSVGDKVYLAASARGSPQPDGELRRNDEILVFSFNKGTLIKKIKVSPNPCLLTYDRSVGKLYVSHVDDAVPRNSVEVIDTASDVIVNTMDIPSQIMFSVVAPGKMYVTAGAAHVPQEKILPRLLVIDTITDKVVKQVNGNYFGISYNPQY